MHFAVVLADPRLREAGQRDFALVRCGESVLAPDNPSVGAVGWVWLANRRALARELGLAQDSGHLTVSLECLRRWGDAGLNRLSGSYSLVVWDTSRGWFLAARDAVGTRPLFYTRMGSGIAFTSSLRLLRDSSGAGARLSRSWVSRYIYGCSADHHLTAYAGVHRVPAGWRVSGSPTDHALQDGRSFDLCPVDETSLSLSWQQRYSEALCLTIEQYLSDGGQAIELTGGVDSTSIAGAARAVAPSRAQDLSVVSYALAGRDGNWALQVAQHLGIGSCYMVSGRRVFRAAGERHFWMGVDAVGHPVEHPNATSHIPLLQFAHREGLGSVLSGFGGDEGVSNEALPAFNELMRSGHDAAAMLTLPGGAASRTLRYVRRRLQSRHWAPPSQHTESVPLIEVLRPELRAEVERAALAFRATSEVLGTVNGQVMAEVGHPMTSIRMEQCSLVAASLGIDYRWPLLDPRLVQVFLAAPTVWKRHRGLGRYLHRTTCAQWVPPRIAMADKAEASRPVVGIRSADTEPPYSPAWDEVRQRLAQVHPQLRELFVSDDTLSPQISAGTSPWQLRQFVSRVDAVDSWFRSVDPVLE